MTICFYTIAIAIVLKVIFWFLLPKKSLRGLKRSFYRYYSQYDMHEAPNFQTKLFWQASNVLNVFIVVPVVIILIVLIFTN
jgi:hypothetical protein